MTDENPLLNDDERETDRQMYEVFGRLRDEHPEIPLSAHVNDILDAQETLILEQAGLMGEKSGEAYRIIGSNVAMAYFHAGLVYGQSVLKHRHHVSRDRHSAAYFDGFTRTYWVDVSDKQKEGPYA